MADHIVQRFGHIPNPNPEHLIPIPEQLLSIDFDFTITEKEYFIMKKPYQTPVAEFYPLDDQDFLLTSINGLDDGDADEWDYFG